MIEQPKRDEPPPKPYEFQEYPKWMYHPDREDGVMVQNAVQERALAEKDSRWRDRPIGRSAGEAPWTVSDRAAGTVPECEVASAPKEEPAAQPKQTKAKKAQK